MEHNNNDIQQAVLTYLQDDMLVDTGEIQMDQNLLATGHVDSFGFIEMITALEKMFQIKFSDDDIQKPEITTVDGLTSLISSHKQKAA